MSDGKRWLITLILGVIFAFAILVVIWYYYPFVADNQCLPMCEQGDQACREACRQSSRNLISDALRQF